MSVTEERPEADDIGDIGDRTRNHSAGTHTTDLFHLAGLEPAQDPGQLVDGGEGGALYPHGLHTQRADDIIINPS